MFKIKREPDLFIGGRENPYLLRWYVIPKNPVFNIYLHKFCRSDDDRALHDHPWLFNMSILLKGDYIEHMPLLKSKWPKDQRTMTKVRRAFGVWFRPGKAPHRVELYAKNLAEFYAADLLALHKGAPIAEEPVWTIFITGPRVREWGFYCKWGWRHWKDFVKNTPGSSEVGRGCE